MEINPHYRIRRKMCKTDEGDHRTTLLVDLPNLSKYNPINNAACSHYLRNTVHWFLLKILPQLAMLVD